MTKDQLLLRVIRECWDCVRDNEISEGLAGAGGMEPKDVKEHYPDFDTEDAIDSKTIDKSAKTSTTCSKDSTRC